jgi:hypothetical protein
MIKKICIVDFDGTLFFTPEPEEGKIVWKEKTGTEWPFVGWWSKPLTLNTDIFEIPINKKMYKEYIKHKERKDTLMVLATGRIIKLEKEVKKILDVNNIKFDLVKLNTGGDTLTFKTKLFEYLIKEYKADELTMYDDRKEHLFEFQKWANRQSIKINVIDVENL